MNNDKESIVQLYKKIKHMRKDIKLLSGALEDIVDGAFFYHDEEQEELVVIQPVPAEKIEDIFTLIDNYRIYEL